MKSTTRLYFIVSILLLVSSYTAQALKPAPLPAGHVFTILEQWHGSSHQRGEFSVMVIYDAKRWQQFWQDYLVREAPGSFDENQHQAVFIELGTRPTGGYAVKVVNAFEENNHLVLEYIEREPAPEQFVTQALATPWVMVLLPRTELRVVTRKTSALPKK